ncbi:MAG: hypothetical protein A2571_00900 [Candidatus Vogelbacteria bacterium RIFOXYD1_FULL_44_32]|uniref:L,D-TPase catalytic domain-containing protein n=1 Tax=Candidatus Vogelbacteria bacterium RIFOXYD1_FULL_44_32 TaxID=1802438 RepID=A0A1G2QFY0_9BACT|nr:MAG: hypothetical protein A2571_00900 [Candidatus Vogelbacteria bacterium RIFOXYD1_FULL_44_32]
MRWLEKLALFIAFSGAISAGAVILVANMAKLAPEWQLATTFFYAQGPNSASASTLNQAITPVEAEIVAPPAPVMSANDDSQKFIRPFVIAKDNLLSSGEKFVVVNFFAKNIELYEGGALVATTSVRALGDPQGWGGTPAGLYNVLDKSERAFSASAEAYMPNALHFYGKYYIHGEPYYASGRKLGADVSGGCVQLADSEAPNFFAQVDQNVPVLAVDKPADDFVYPSGAKTVLPNISAKSFLVADLDSGEIIADQDSTKVFPIASITKLMTAVVVAEHIDLRRNIEIEPKDLEAFGDTAGLDLEKSFRVVELFYPLLIESSNDTAEVVARFLGREATIDLMNEKAERLFMTDTRYADVSGFDVKNTSTARDLYLLGRYIKNNRRPILDITKGKAVTSFGPVRFDVRQMENKNEFAKGADFIGGKSGYLDEAKNTGLFMFKIKVAGEEREVAIVVLKSEHLKKDVEVLKGWVERNYK